MQGSAGSYQEPDLIAYSEPFQITPSETRESNQGRSGRLAYHLTTNHYIANAISVLVEF